MPFGYGNFFSEIALFENLLHW
jgi:hypothetical protein